MSFGPPGGATETTSLPDVLEVVPSGPLSGALRAPASKSVTNRLLVAAALAKGTSLLCDVLDSGDTRVMADGLRALGARIEGGHTGGSPTRPELQVAGTGGRLAAPVQPIDAGLSGTTLRFLAGAALLVPGTVIIDGAAPLRLRPIAPLLDALRHLGAVVASDDGRPPLRITSRGLRGGQVYVDAWQSSQFVTALLLVAPYADADVEIIARRVGAAGYVDLTLETMARWGAPGRTEGVGHYLVEGGRAYRARHEEVEYDASAAAHLMALAMATGGSITITNARRTLQPDARIVAVFRDMGATVAPGDGAGLSLSVTRGLEGVDVDISPFPDQLPTIAVLGALASGTTRLTNAAVARGHETDRLIATARELSRLGGDVEVNGDTLTVRGGRLLHGAEVLTYDDHRMAMAFAPLAAVVPGVRIRDPRCVGKTYPGYWADASRLGLKIGPLHPEPRGDPPTRAPGHR